MTYDVYLAHHGILGQKWGVRRGPPYPLSGDSFSSFRESEKVIKVNADGSKVIPSGFVFNRVGKESLDLNKAGALYVSYGKEDAARYIKYLGQTPIRKMLGLSVANTVQHIKAKSSLHIPSDEQLADATLSFFINNEDLLNIFNESIYSMIFDKEFSKNNLSSLQKDDAKRFLYAISSMLGDGYYSNISKNIMMI